MAMMAMKGMNCTKAAAPEGASAAPPPFCWAALKSEKTNGSITHFLTKRFSPA
jgi:hypothetical protein